MRRPAPSTSIWRRPTTRTTSLPSRSRQIPRTPLGCLIFWSTLLFAAAKSNLVVRCLNLSNCSRYPVRDPFFKMLPRSLSNFMNAFTSSDHTTYPFATTNHQDFKNLFSVYMDATLNPLLSESDFLQEGWRIGPKSLQGLGPDASKKEREASQQLEFKGVVY